MAWCKNRKHIVFFNIKWYNIYGYIIIGGSMPAKRGLLLMKCARIYLSEDKRVSLDTYIAENKSVVRDAMLIFPGGG